MIAYKVIETNTTFVQQGIPEQCKLPCYREFISFGTIGEPRAIANDDMTNRWYYVVDRIWCERRMCTTRHVDAIVDIGPVCMRDDGNSLDFVASSDLFLRKPLDRQNLAQAIHQTLKKT